MSTDSRSSLFLRAKDDPTLSLAMIVKNEVSTIKRCLRSARPHVDELVIVDTGSSDGTRAIARKYADVYDEIEWPNSFSKARNHSYALATEDYIMYLDGDEYVPSPIDWELIRKTIAQPRIGLVQLRLHNLLPPGSMVSASEIWHERITINTSEIRWEGKVHNQIVRSAKSYMRRNDLRPVKVSAEIVHTGYALEAEDKREKYSERLPLLLEEYTDPRSAISRAYYGFQLSLVYQVLGQQENAYEVTRELDYELLNAENGFYAHYIGARSALHLDELEEALSHCEAMLSLTKDEPVAYFTLAIILLRKHEIYEGILTLIEAYRVNEDPNRHPRFQMNRDFLLEKLEELFDQGEFSHKARRVLGSYITAQGESPATEQLANIFEKAMPNQEAIKNSEIQS